MKENKVPSSGRSAAETAERLFLLLGLLSFSLLVFSISSIAASRITFNIKNVYSIILMCCAGVFALSCIGVVVACCLQKDKKVTSTSVAIDFGVQQSTSSLTLLAMSAVSLTSFAALFGVLHSAKGISALVDFNNPVCIAMYVSLAILTLSLLSYTLKSIVAPDRQNHLIIIGDSATVNSVKNSEMPTIVSAMLSIDFSSLASIQAVNATQQQIDKERI
ncbi:hypothetical protein [Ehrlichia japonica]|uniref:Uncharacterized protein n=1 Tax=Ehrlichia japonica TaxID=391036 RepID=X5GIG1_9RICK|nr:hypothetical protein [Ehrlichia japonica]AHX04233.1 hypothetical protein EHF_0123 [Ehrlichia japonica]